ncbi:MAG TPA: glycosyltransferase family 9 protein [Saprospiraceae bacterium]|nr:glycosyltransferase family 9 protein [Saprospiraceae bacterium]
MKPKKILIIRFSSIGDIVLTTPVIRALRQQLNAEIHFLTKPAFASIVAANPYVSQVFSLREEMNETLSALAAEKYELIVDLHKNLRSQRVKFALGGKSVSFDKLNLQKWILVNLKWNFLPAKHIVDRYLEPVRYLGVQYDGQGLDFFIPKAEEIDVAVLADQFFSHQEKERADLANQRFVALVVGAAHATKRLLPEQLAAIARQIQAPVLLLGGPDDREVGAAIAEKAGPQVRSLCGKYTLAGSASLVRQAAVVISHDTGLMHIAAAFNRPIISVWGNTIPELGMSPFYESNESRGVIMEVKGLSCRPCSKIGFDKCPKGHFKCMKEQSIPKIVAQVHEKLLNAF